jgi:hypothetical protein
MVFLTEASVCNPCSIRGSVAYGRTKSGGGLPIQGGVPANVSHHLDFDGNAHFILPLFRRKEVQPLESDDPAAAVLR